MANPNTIAQLKAQATAKLKLPENIVKNIAVEIEKEIEKVEQTGKTFFAKVSHSRFVHNDGTETIFHFGKAHIINPAHIKELEAICPPLGNNPNIYTQDKIPETLPTPKMNAVDEISLGQAEAAISSHNITKVEQQTGPVVIGGIASSSPSAIDSELLAAAKTGGSSPFETTQVITPVPPEKVESLVNNAMQSTS